MKSSPLSLLFMKRPEETPRRETRLLALHSYDSSNPEDLSFHQGDVITLLSKGDLNLLYRPNDRKKQDSNVLTDSSLQ